MSDRPLRVRIDRLVLRNVDSGSVAEIAPHVAEHLRSSESGRTADDKPIPNAGTAMVDAAAARIAAVVRRAVGDR